MFKKAPKAKGFRKREADSDDGADGASAVVRQAPPTRKRGNAFSTKQDDDGSDDEVVNKGTAVFESSRSAAPMSHRGGAFETVETDTAVDRDARTLLERQIQMQKDGLTNDDTGLYQGAASYKSYVKINDAQVGANKFTGTKGPIRAPQFARATCRFDYQPDVCKDYKDTGYCGYGDGCKFMHDRGQYKTGWQLEQEFKFTKERQKEREMAGKMGDDSDEEREKDKYTIRGGNDDDLPFACHLCRGPFNEPMRTQCGHYFCSKCANKRFRTNTRCPVCDKQTSGVLNAAPKLAAKAKLVGGYEALLASALVDSSPADDGAPADAYQNEAVAPVPHVAALAKKFAPKPMPKTSGDWSVVNF